MSSNQPNRTPEQMFALIDRWQSSDQSQISFCLEQDIPVHVFRYWLKKYNTQPSDRVVQGFIPVSLDAAGGNEIIEIRYPTGVLLRLPASTGIDTVRSLLTVSS